MNGHLKGKKMNTFEAVFAPLTDITIQVGTTELDFLSQKNKMYAVNGLHLPVP